MRVFPLQAAFLTTGDEVAMAIPMMKAPLLPAQALVPRMVAIPMEAPLLPMVPDPWADSVVPWVFRWCRTPGQSLESLSTLAVAPWV